MLEIIHPQKLYARMHGSKVRRARSVVRRKEASDRWTSLDGLRSCMHVVVVSDVVKRHAVKITFDVF